MKMINSIFECYRDIIPDYDIFCESLRKPFPLCLRINTLKTDEESLHNIFRKKGIRLEYIQGGRGILYRAHGIKSPGNLLEYFLGYIHSQALTSCLAAITLSPGEECRVLDLCASPGGKTSHLAQIMNNRGIIVANELYRSRHIPLAHTLSRLGVVNTVFTDYQAQEFPLRQNFDYILADVPCSGEGRVRRPGEGNGRSWNGKLNMRPRLLELQKKIILRGYDLLGDNGVMLYATCTYNPEENEEIINFLLENRDAKLLPINLNCDFEPGLTQWKGNTYDKRLELAARFYPHRIDSVGFFMARIGRR